MGKVKAVGAPRITIGQAAKRAGLTAKAIRLSERRGLLGPAERTDCGYRTYGPEELAVLGFIRQAKTVGLRLEEIRTIIDLQRSGRQPCGTVIDLLDSRLADIDRTMADLQTLRATMAVARARAQEAVTSGDDAVICRLIETPA